MSAVAWAAVFLFGALFAAGIIAVKLAGGSFRASLGFRLMREAAKRRRDRSDRT